MENREDLAKRPDRYVEPMDEPSRRSHMDVLSSQLDRYEKNLAVLRTRLSPVLSQHAATYAEVRPEEVAEHPLHEQLNRLESCNQGLESIIGEIAL